MYYLGIDGGSSKTQCAIIDKNGKVRAQLRGPGSAIIGIPSPGDMRVIISLVNQCCKKARITPDNIKHFCVGLSGVDFEDEIPGQVKMMAATLDISAKRLSLVNDGIVALWGATSAPNAAIIQHGSALTSAYRKGFGTEKIFDNLSVGTIFDIRHQTLALMARMIDGRARKTGLLDLVLSHLGIKNKACFAEMVYRKRLVPQWVKIITDLVYKAYQRKDPAAVSLVEQALKDYALFAKVMARKIGRKHAVIVFGGGVIMNSSTQFKKRLLVVTTGAIAGAQVSFPRLYPEIGAAIMAAYHDGVDPMLLYGRLDKQSTAKCNLHGSQAKI